MHRRLLAVRHHGAYRPDGRGPGRAARPSAVPIGPPPGRGTARRHRNPADPRLRQLLRRDDGRRGPTLHHRPGTGGEPCLPPGGGRLRYRDTDRSGALPRVLPPDGADQRRRAAAPGLAHRSQAGGSGRTGRPDHGGRVGGGRASASRVRTGPPAGHGELRRLRSPCHLPRLAGAVRRPTNPAGRRPQRLAGSPQRAAADRLRPSRGRRHRKPIGRCPTAWPAGPSRSRSRTFVRYCSCVMGCACSTVSSMQWRTPEDAASVPG